MPEPRLIDRRTALGLLGAGGLVLAGCGSSSSDGTAAPSSTTAATDAAGAAIPTETAGPYPGDGSNGPNALTTDGVVRQDIRTSFGGLSGTAEGVPLALQLTVVAAGTGEPLTGAALYAWHSTREGGYSLYSEGVTDQNFLRGVQEAGDDGTLRFTTVFPGAYDGRWPHVHLEVYESVEAATGGGTPLVISQLALPEDVCDEVYATEGYEASVANLQRTSLESDMVFSDGVDQQLAAVTGAVNDGLVASLVVPV
jgi:protocatechuate 3,4-dioxygenase beta subunit